MFGCLFFQCHYPTWRAPTGEKEEEKNKLKITEEHTKNYKKYPL